MSSGSKTPPTGAPLSLSDIVLVIKGNLHMKVKLFAHIAGCFLLHRMRMRRPFANNASVCVGVFEEVRVSVRVC